MNDYEDLAFKPAMTWEELCEYANSKGATKGAILNDDSFLFQNLYFNKDGSIYSAFTGNIATNRTYEQMKNIIDNLYGE